MQAVVWTDVIQITAMFGAMILVAIKGTIDVGGFGVVIQRNMNSGRIEAPEYPLVFLIITLLLKIYSK